MNNVSGLFRSMICLTFLTTLQATAQQPDLPLEIPKSHDPRMVVELFASSPDIVHPIGLDFDAKGRMLVIESHTHFRPANYQGPEFDRIRMIDITDTSTKRKQVFSTFFEGTKATMGIAVHPDGSVYLATRNEILRLKDTKGVGKADIKERIAFLDTKGDYPHNGLSGLCFDSQGNLYFGMGENIGAAYKMIGSDGTTISGEGDGGHIFWCTADGKKLRRVATGFWNPFGVCRDIYGRMFAVDNDPDAMPPCRLLHVVEGGDYGFQFRYGRSGRHPFQSWNGELPGTLPMICGTGEAPCQVLSYESDNLPAEYLGNLLVTAWADHRVERYRLKAKGASFTSQREPFIQGGKDFRPVGMAVAPDGSIFVSDWVRRDYNLHGKGAIWHIRSKDVKPAERPQIPILAIESRHRPLRDWAAREMCQRQKVFVIQQLERLYNFKKKLPWARQDSAAAAAYLTAIMNLEDVKTYEKDKLLDIFRRVAERPYVDMEVRTLALRMLSDLRQRPLFEVSDPTLQFVAMPTLTSRDDRDLRKLIGFLGSSDPFLRHAAVWHSANSTELLKELDDRGPVRISAYGLFLAHRGSAKPNTAELLPRFLADNNDEIRFLAAKWIADEKLVEFRPQVAEAMKNPKLNVRMYTAYATALARLDGQPVNEAKLAEYFFDRLADEKSPAATRVLALQLVPARFGRLNVAFLQKLLVHDDPGLKLEAVRTLAEHPDGKRFGLLLEVARNPQMSEAIRAQAILGLSDKAQDHVDQLLELVGDNSAVLREEALRGLVGAKLGERQRGALVQVATKPQAGLLVGRVLGKPFYDKRPAAKDIDGWLKHLEGPADTAVGRRLFAHPRLGGCFRCHRVEGRGNEVGPDLSTIGRTERRAILESILQPGNNVAPHYQAWVIETADGKVRTGMLTNTHLDDYTYLDAKGALFHVNTRDVVSIQPSPNSIMPDGLADQLTDQEMRDLLAYLVSRR